MHASLPAARSQQATKRGPQDLIEHASQTDATLPSKEEVPQVRPREESNRILSASGVVARNEAGRQPRYGCATARATIRITDSRMDKDFERPLI
jgi:hypothetical protein